MHAFSKGTAVAKAATIAISNGLHRDPLRFWDIGARWGLSRSMEALYRLGVLAPAFFEPEPSEASTLTKAYPQCRIFDCALWNSNGAADLYITKDPGQSSLLRPLDQGIVVSHETIITRRADELLNASFIPEIIKLDVQGAEINVLDGFGPMLDRVVCIEVEVSIFQRFYQDQPMIDDVVTFLAARGFGLFDIRVFGVHSTRCATYANAFFSRRELRTEREISIERIFLALNRISIVY